MMSLLLSTLAFCLAFMSPESGTDYKEYWNSVRNEISSAAYYGRNWYKDGDIRAARYIIDRIIETDGMMPLGDKTAENVEAVDAEGQPLLPYGPGRFCTYGNADTYKPFLQNFITSHNALDGNLSVAIDGMELEAFKTFTPKACTCGAQGTFKLVAADEKKIAGENALEYLNSGVFKNSFAVFPSKLIKSSRKFNYEVATILNPEKIAGIALTTKHISFGSYQNFYQTSVPLITINESSIPEGSKEITVDIEAHLINDHDCHNIVAYLPGTDPSLEEYYTLVAHYDHHGIIGKENILYGANDNASSSAMLLALAGYFSKNRPARGILFIWTAEEEAGLLGSYYYAQKPALPLDKIKFLINLEQMSDNGNDMWSGNNNEGNKEFERLMAINVNNGEYTPFRIVRAGFHDNSDHYPFGIKGVPVCYVATVGENNSKFYHTPCDSLENTYDENFARVFRMLVTFLTQE